MEIDPEILQRLKAEGSGPWARIHLADWRAFQAKQAQLARLAELYRVEYMALALGFRPTDTPKYGGPAPVDLGEDTPEAGLVRALLDEDIRGAMVRVGTIADGEDDGEGGS